MAAAWFLLYLGIWLWLPEGKPLSPRIGTWRAPADDPHVRRLQQSGALREYTVSVQVVKQDAFGAEPARVDVSFIPPGHSESDRVTVSFAATDGNAGNKMPMGLQNEASVNITGFRETDTTQAAALKASMKDRALASSVTAGVDERGVFVAQAMAYERDAGALSGQWSGRRLAGNAAAQNTAVVVLYQPCGNSLKADVTKDRVQSAFFDSTTGSFQQVIGKCSRGTVSFSGAVIGPIDGCPTSSDAWSTYSAVEAQLRDNPDWSNNYFKLMILPSAWLSSVGLGTVGGSISWYREDYVDSPVLFLHEIGHNWKLHHAGGPFKSQEYSDTSSAMGYCCRTRCFNFLHAWQLGFADFAEEVLSLAEIAKPTSTALTLKALGTSAESGVKIEVTTSSNGRRLDVPAYLVLSWRASMGTDDYLQGTAYGNKLQVHHWDGDSRTDASITHLLHQVSKGSSVLIQDTDRSGERILTDLKLTVKSGGASDTAQLLLCQRLSSEGAFTAASDLTPCPEASPETTTPAATTAAATSSSSTTTAAPSESTTTVSQSTTTTVGESTSTTESATTTWENPGGPWSDYFVDQTSSELIAPGTALVGLGCKDPHCAAMRLSHRADLPLSGQSVTIHQLNADIGDLICQSGQVATQVTCVGDSCQSFQLRCATPTQGRVGEAEEMTWFPSELHATEESYCRGDAVVVGIYCGGSHCVNKKLMCARYSAEDQPCVPSCDVLGLECGDDGCGGSCGTCSSEDSSLTPMCRGDVGRCVYFVSSEWVTSDQKMSKTHLVSTGMSCANRFCGTVNLIQMSVFVDAATAEKSGWISDNTGHRWFWNSGTAAEDQVADCPAGMAVSYVECDGKHCDNLRFHCAKPLQWTLDMSETPEVTGWFSEEDGRKDCPGGKVMTGVECKDSKKWCVSNCGSYCDNKRLRCRSIRPEMAGSAILGILGAQELPSSSDPVPPAASPWYEEAQDSISDIWNGLRAGFQEGQVDAAQHVALGLGLLTAGMAW